MTSSSDGATPTDAPASTRRRWIVVGTLGVLILVVAFVLVVFQPQRLLIDVQVDEALPGLSVGAPGSVAPPGPVDAARAPASMPPSPPTSSTPAGPVAVARGSFSSIAHPTAGTALLVRLPDGSHLVRLEQFETDNGPDVWVGISGAAAGSGDYSSLRRLEPLKGNIGNQNYVLPDDVDVAALRSVVIWCERFSVAFGDAALDRSSA